MDFLLAVAVVVEAKRVQNVVKQKRQNDAHHMLLQQS